jgi:hypothetical protein
MESNHGWQKRVQSRTDCQAAQGGGGSFEQGIIDRGHVPKDRNYERYLKIQISTWYNNWVEVKSSLPAFISISLKKWRESMRIELTFPDQSQETADLKSGTGTSTVTSPSVIANCKTAIEN